MADSNNITPEQLVEVLKFTPRSYTVRVWGYGGEISMGRISQETVNYFKKNFISVSEYATSWSSEDDDDFIKIPDDLRPFPQGSWYDCEDIEHCSGAEFGGSTIQVENENGEVVWERDLGSNLEDEGCEISEFCDEDIEEYVSNSSSVFVGQSFEKGTFFEGEIDLTQPFDPAKFKFTYSTVAGWPILNTVEYDCDEIDGSGGYDTTGKSSEYKFYYENDEGDVVDYDTPSDEEMGVPEYGASPNDWEKSPAFKFKKHKPVYIGWYKTVWGYGSTFGSLYWDGSNFVEFDYGRPVEVDQKGVEFWQGYNWDTSSWSNQPPAPPEYKCKKCNWTGIREELIEDNEYNSMCPHCKSKDVNWIEYDPETKEGVANRKKFIKEWDPVKALDEILATSTREELTEAVEELTKDRDPNAKWPF